jgi:hypothetical protein
MSQLKFEKVGHSVYVLEGEACLGRLKERYDNRLYFEAFEPWYPFSKEQLQEIIAAIDNKDLYDPR